MAILDQGYVRAAMGYWYHHVQSIMLAIGQYAETALGDPECFLNKPAGIHEGQHSVEQMCPICAGNERG